MKTISKLICIASVVLCGQVSAASIGWGSSPAVIEVNDIFTVDIVGNGFTSNVDGGGVNFSYDSSVLNILAVSIDGSVWDFGGTGISTGTIDNGAGSVDGIMMNTFGNVTGNFVVATVQFQAMGIGTSGLDLSEFLLNPWASGGSLLNPDFLGGSLTVSAPSAVVPVPAAAWLFGSGLLGLIGMARRKKA